MRRRHTSCSLVTGVQTGALPICQPHAPAPQEKDRAIGIISKRADFLAANKGRRMAMPGFVLLVHDGRDGEPVKRLGITVTKKIGGAVVRNRMKRRFRALARELMPDNGRAGADHILIDRKSTRLNSSH